MKKGRVQNKKFMLFSIMAFFAVIIGPFLIIPFNVKPMQTELDKVKASSGFTNIGTLANDYRNTSLEDATIYMITSDLTINASRITLKENSTAVIYVAAGCTLNAESGITLQSCGFIGSVTGGSNTGLLTGNLNDGSVIDCFANSTTNYAITKGSGTIKSSLYIQNKDNNNI